MRTENIFQTTAAMDVKIFVQKDPADAEKAVSQWLRQNNVVIHHIGQSQSERGGHFVFTISLFYSRLEG